MNTLHDCNIPKEQALTLMLIYLVAVMIAMLGILIWRVAKHTRMQATNPPRAEQDAKMLDVAHEIEDAIHEYGQIPHYNPAYLDPVLQMYVVGRVSRVQMHSSILDWLKRGTDYRLEENKFW